MRTALALSGFLAAITLPPWVAILCMVILCVRYRAWEVLFIGMIIDLTWLPSGISIHALPLCTGIALLLVWGLEPLRRQFLLRQ